MTAEGSSEKKPAPKREGGAPTGRGGGRGRGRGGRGGAGRGRGGRGGTGGDARRDRSRRGGKWRGGRDRFAKKPADGAAPAADGAPAAEGAEGAPLADGTRLPRAEQPRRRHRPRGGRQRENNSDEQGNQQLLDDEGNPIPVPEGADAAPSAPAKKSKKKETSDFTKLLQKLDSAKAFAEHVRTQPLGSRNLNAYLQAFSNQKAELYEKFFNEFKSEAATVLERVVEAHNARINSAESGGADSGLALKFQKRAKAATKAQQQNSAVKPQLSAATHEFVIRCEAAGMKKSSWMTEDVKPIPAVIPSAGDKADEAPEADDAASKTVGAKQEMIPKIKKKLPTPAPEVRTAFLLSPKEMIQLLNAADMGGKTLRRIEMCRAVDDFHKVVACMEKSEYKEAVPPAEHSQIIGRLLGKLRACATVPKAKASTSSAPAEEKKEEEGEEAAKAEEEQVSEETVETASAKLSKEEASEVAALLVQLCGETFTAGGSTKPPAKLQHTLKWMQSMGFLAEDDKDVQALEEVCDSETLKQAEQLEIVIKLKSVDKDRDMFDETVKELLDEESGALVLRSPDVLSALAVATLKFDDDKLLAQIAGALQQTQELNVTLPRRALALIEKHQQRVKSAKTASKVAALNAAAEAVGAKRKRAAEDDDDMSEEED